MKISDLKKIRDRAQKSLDLRSGPKEYRIVVSMGTSGIAAGARDVMKMLLNEIETQGLENVELTVTGSAGFDDAEPEWRGESNLWAVDSRCCQKSNNRTYNAR